MQKSISIKYEVDIIDKDRLVDAERDYTANKKYQFSHRAMLETQLKMESGDLEKVQVSLDED